MFSFSDPCCCGNQEYARQPQPKTPFEQRRLKRLAVSQDLMEFLLGNWRDWPNAMLPEFPDLPADVKLCGVNYDFDSQSFLLLLASQTFDVVADGEIIPKLDPELARNVTYAQFGDYFAPTEPFVRWEMPIESLNLPDEATYGSIGLAPTEAMEILSASPDATMIERTIVHQSGKEQKAVLFMFSAKLYCIGAPIGSPVGNIEREKAAQVLRNLRADAEQPMGDMAREPYVGLDGSIQ